jgi:hypothetical protein
LPQPALHTALALGVGWRRAFEIAIEVALDWSGSVAAREGRIQIGAASARVRAGPLLVFGDAELALGASAAIGPMWGTAAGFPGNGAPQVLTFFEVALGARAAIRMVGPLWLEAGASLGLVPLRPLFFLRDGDGSIVPLFETSWVTGTFTAGLRALFL